MGEEEGVPVLQVRGDLALVDRGLLGVGEEHHDKVGLRRRRRRREHPQPFALCFRPRRRAFAQPYPHIDTGVAQVERVGMALGAVADDGDGSGADEGLIGVFLVVKLGHGRVFR